MRQAQACYARDDLGCVVELLAPSTATASEDDREGLRLLAFAYARLDRHTEARRTFGLWRQRVPGVRLEQASTPPAVWSDYAAVELSAVLPQLAGRQAEFGVGHRPFLPDTKPVIDRSPRLRNVLLAVGHGQLGLTLGATTGRLIADLAVGRASNVDLTPFRCTRF